MNKKMILLAVAIGVIIGVGIFVFLRQTYVSPEQQLLTTQQLPNPQQNTATSAGGFNYDEIIKARISSKGGVLQNADGSVIVTIPPLSKDIDFTISFKRSDYKVSSGTASPVTIKIYPDVDLMAIGVSSASSPIPIEIKAKYDKQYNLMVPYLIHGKGRLSAVDLGSIDRKNNSFTMQTFHGGDYSWIYVN